MSLTNISKPSTSLTNSTRITDFETWDSNPNTWDTETRTWDECGNKMDNSSRISSSITNQSKP